MIAVDLDADGGEHRVKGGGEFCVPVPDQEPQWSACWPKSMSGLRACCATQAPVG
jgi:hypothetical protein